MAVNPYVLDDGTEVDRGIATVIQDLRRHGITTTHSCSGLASDHEGIPDSIPYISIKLSEGVEPDTDFSEHRYEQQSLLDPVEGDIPEGFPHANEEYADALVQVFYDAPVDWGKWHFMPSTGEETVMYRLWPNDIWRFADEPCDKDVEELTWDDVIVEDEDDEIAIRDDKQLLERWEALADELLKIPPEIIPEFTND